MAAAAEVGNELQGERQQSPHQGVGHADRPHDDSYRDALATIDERRQRQVACHDRFLGGS